MFRKSVKYKLFAAKELKRANHWCGSSYIKLFCWTDVGINTAVLLRTSDSVVTAALSAGLWAPTLLWPFLWSVHTLKDPCISSFPSSLRFPCEQRHTDSQTFEHFAVAASLWARACASSVAVAHQVGFMENQQSIKSSILYRYFCVSIMPLPVNSYLSATVNLTSFFMSFMARLCDDTALTDVVRCNFVFFGGGLVPLLILLN